MERKNVRTGFHWMGRPVIQLPEDMIRIQEVIWRVRPDVIVETGVAHGGSLIFYASLFEAMGHGRVIGIDIDIRSHNRTAIEAHRMAEAHHPWCRAVPPRRTPLAVVRHQPRAGRSASWSVLDFTPQPFARRRRAGYVRANGVAVCYIVACDGIMAQVAGVPVPRPTGPGTTRSPRWKSSSTRNRDFVARSSPGFAFKKGLCATMSPTGQRAT